MRNIKYTKIQTVFFLSLFLISSSCIQKEKEFKIIDQKQITLTAHIPEDSTILKIIEPYKDSVNKVMGQIIGYSDELLTSYKPESPLTNFVSDLLLEYGKVLLKNNDAENLPAIAIVNSKGLRAPIPIGEITTRHIYELMPFENYMVAVKLSGNQIIELCNHIVSEGGDGLSGATFEMKNNSATKILINNKPVEKSKNYWVIAPDYLAQGGDHYVVLTKASKIIESGETLRDLIIKKIKELDKDNQKVIAPKNQRIFNK